MKIQLSLAAIAAALALSAQPAMSADLGGDCCADLEERIAELEATTARKGNRKVSLEISGWVNTAVLYFDDGEESNAYVVDNAQDRSRLRFRGKAKVTADVEAGYLLELGFRVARNDRLSATSDDNADGVDIRHAAWYINSKTYGKVTVGQTSQASDGITQINLSGINHAARSQVFDWNQNFGIRNSDGTQSGVTWRGLTYRENPGEGNRNNLVRYDTPTYLGFTASAAWGEDDIWDVGLRYAGEFQGFKLGAGIAYTQSTDSDTSANTSAACRNGSTAAGTSDVRCDSLGLSVSVLHVGTGLYGTFAYGYHEDDRRAAAIANATVPDSRVDDRDEFFYFQGGIQQKWLPIGKTTIYGEYYRGEFGTGGGQAGTAAALVNGAAVLSSDVDMWGFGLNQSIDAAAMDLYIGYRNYQADVQTVNGKVGGLEEFQAVLGGGIIRF